MRLLDLFCGAGGSAMGYHRAGFEVVGVDIAPQPRYPFEFHQADALEYLAEHGHEFDVIHASPPCQPYSVLKGLVSKEYKKLIGDVRGLMSVVGKPYVIENVEGAKSEMINPLTLCGTMFGLKTRRHRLFEMSSPIYFAPAVCRHYLKTQRQGMVPHPHKHFISVAGHFSDQDFARRAMGIDWMSRAELAQAIPPAYTEFIGRHLMQTLQAVRFLVTQEN
jgi:DNA (cytosine-5)-methyltransferase 1